MSDKPMLIADAAKLLRIGSKTLFAILHEEKVLSEGTNLPRHELELAGYFKVITRTYHIGRSDHSHGTPKPYPVTTVTDLGLTFLQDVINNHRAKQQSANSAQA